MAEVDHINLHATASLLNDQADAKAVDQLFPNPPPCSGVKGLLGHTLGAAGAVEAVVSLLALERGFVPGTCGLEQPDPQCPCPVIATPLLDRRPRLVLSNAFGFGGNNASVLLEACLMECMSLLGFSACAPDAEFRAGLPFPAFDIDRDAIPPMLRRRSSQATQMAFSAAAAACAQADRSAAALPTVFASVAGEIQTTDLLCNELAKPEGVISPSAFHNSVQNTASGYWCIARQCTQPSSALSAGFDTFAMALLEAWCQLDCQGGEIAAGLLR